MAKRPKKTQKSQVKLKGFVIVTFAEDLDQARDYQSLLKTNGVPATIKEHTEQSLGIKNFAVMVPESFLDEAYAIIESQDSYDDFYDFALENEEDNGFDSDFMDDDF
jgi:hypothetical protein